MKNFSDVSKFFAGVKNLFVHTGTMQVGKISPVYRKDDFENFYRMREAWITHRPCQDLLEVELLYIGTPQQNFGDCFAIKHADGYMFCPIGGTKVMYATRHDLIVRPITEFSTTLLDGHLLVEGSVRKQELVVEKTSILSEGQAIELPCSLAQLVQKLS
jgi:hypothetical protein